MHSAEAMMSVFLFMGLFVGTVNSLTCNIRCNTSANVTHSSPVRDYCENHNLTMSDNHRCCINATKASSNETVIVGVDFRNCSLHNTTDLFTNITSVVILTLEDNEIKSTSPEDFYKLTSLEYLSLTAKNEKCPGGSDAWNSTDVIDGIRICQSQLNTCHNKENNGTCPSPESYCSFAGPGLVDCFCSPGYHGYKCLRQGKFPLAQFVGGIGGSTVVLSLFLWITQRRRVKKNQ